jgi:hypothetical protein
MPIYHSLGTTPRKRHVVFRQPSGRLYTEELMGNMGFTGPASLVYHVHQPTQVLRIEPVKDLAWVAGEETTFRNRHFCTARLSPARSATADRIPLLFNADVALSFVQPTEDDEYFYRNAQGDEVVFVSDGAGVLESPLGRLVFGKGDYLVVPRGIAHRCRFTERPVRLLVIESTGFVRTPRRYRNDFGQLTENAPFSERDIRRPGNLETVDRKGEFPIVVKKNGRLTRVVVNHHPCDVVGWDGYYYPWAFNINDFEPRVAAAGPSDVRGRRVRRLLVLPAAVRLRSEHSARALRALQRDVRRGDLLRQRGVHEPQGHRVWVGHAASGRRCPRPASRPRRGVARSEGDQRTGGHDRHVQAAARRDGSPRHRRPGLPPVLDRA